MIAKLSNVLLEAQCVHKLIKLNYLVDLDYSSFTYFANFYLCLERFVKKIQYQQKTKVLYSTETFWLVSFFFDKLHGCYCAEGTSFDEPFHFFYLLYEHPF